MAVPIQQVRTRDNHLVAFDRGRIVEAILEAMAEAGTGDRSRADEMASAVSHFLDSFHVDPVDVETIHDMVEKVLMETGQRTIARAYVLLREKRARIRERIRVRSDAPEKTRTAPTVEGSGASAAQPWNRGRIIHALIEEADLDAETAEEIAQAVEERVLRSGLATISSSLLRELVDNELFERGLTGRLRRQSPVSIPKYDLEQILFRGGDATRGWFVGDAAQTASQIGERIIRQYVLEEVFSSDVREAYLGGDLHLHQLDGSLGVLRTSVCADNVELRVREHAALEDPRPERGYRRVFHGVFRRVRDLLANVAEEIEVLRIGEALIDVHRDRQPDALACGQELVAALTSFHAYREARSRTGPAVVLRFPFTPRTAATPEPGTLFADDACVAESSLFAVEALYQGLQALLETRQDAHAVLAGYRLRFEVSPRTFDDFRFRNALQGVMNLLPPEVSVTFRLVDDNRGFDPAEIANVAGKVTLNLPRLALEMRREEETEPARRLRAAVGRAISALEERGAFLERMAVQRDPVETPTEYVIGLVGLADAVKIFTGQALHEGASAFAAARLWVDTVLAAVDENQSRLGGRLLVEETPNRGPVRRFDALDREIYEGTSPFDGSPHHYCSGVRFDRRAPLDPLASWNRTQELGRGIRLLDRLEDHEHLRSDGVQVLMAFLDETSRLKQSYWKTNA